MQTGEIAAWEESKESAKIRPNPERKANNLVSEK